MPHIVLESAEAATSLAAHAAYGETREVGGQEFIPVALAWHGFGGGGDTAGGGGVSIPVGAYVRRGDDLQFEPNLIALLAVSIPLVWVTGRVLRKLFRGRRRR